MSVFSSFSLLLISRLLSLFILNLWASSSCQSWYWIGEGIAPPCFVLIYYYLEEPLVHYIANTLGHPKCAQKCDQFYQLVWCKENLWSNSNHHPKTFWLDWMGIFNRPSFKLMTNSVSEKNGFMKDRTPQSSGGLLISCLLAILLLLEFVILLKNATFLRLAFSVWRCISFEV